MGSWKQKPKCFPYVLSLNTIPWHQMRELCSPTRQAVLQQTLAWYALILSSDTLYLEIASTSKLSPLRMPTMCFQIAVLNQEFCWFAWASQNSGKHTYWFIIKILQKIYMKKDTGQDTGEGRQSFPALSGCPTHLHVLSYPEAFWSLSFWGHNYAALSCRHDWFKPLLINLIFSPSPLLGGRGWS